MFDFGYALFLMKQGNTVTNGVVTLAVQFPDAKSKMGKPYIYKVVKHGKTTTLVPHVVTNEELFDDNWTII